MARTGVLWALAFVFVVNGALHFLWTDAYAAIVPPWAPDARFAVQATGVASLLGGAGLLVPPLRKAAGVGLALYCVAVFPANIHHALGDVAVAGRTADWTYHGPRLLLQPALVWACLWAAGVIDWPLAKR
ncbi:MAG: hypothetical protein NW200_09880 [Hyphomonadaceae bacterium]|nr:hypothetical protein [Hyphomonadaceae bacterium]